MKRLESLTATVLRALAVAASLSIIVLVIGVIGAVVYAVKFGVPALMSDFPEGVGAILLIVASYFVAALLAAPVYHAIVPLARWLPGEMLVAAVLGFIVYGTIGVTSVIAYVNFDINIMDYESASEAWQSILPAACALGVLTGLVGPLIWRYQASRG